MPPQHPLVLVERTADGEVTLATHDRPVSDTIELQHDGAAIELTQLMGASQLANEAALKAAGDELYRRIALGDVGVELAKLGFGCRFVLDLRSRALEALPWELLRRDGFDVFKLPTVPWSVAIPEQRSPLVRQAKAFELPLRVLVVIGHRVDDPEVRGDDELEALEDMLHACQVQTLRIVLRRPDPEDIDRELQVFQPHVFHFVGHGRVVNGEPVFDVYSERRSKNERWGPSRVQAIFAANGAPRLVILNACEAGTPQTTSSLIRAFLSVGAQFVLAMQAEIMSTAAVRFSRELYARIANADPLDVAVAQARHVVGNAGVGNDKTQWPVARLVVGGEIEAVPFRGDAPTKGLAPAAADFVHRWQERNRAWEGFCCSSRLLVVDGAADVGKSEFLKVMAQTWSRSRRCAAVYVDLGGPETSDLARASERIRDGLAAIGLDVSPFGSIEPDQSSTDLGRQLRKALEVVAGESELLLLVDGFEKWDRNVVLNTVIPELCLPYLHADATSHVRVVIALRKEVSDDAHWEASTRRLKIDDFSAAEWRSAANQFIRWHRRALAESKRQYFEDVAFPAAKLLTDGTLRQPYAASYEAKMFKVIRWFALAQS